MTKDTFRVICTGLMKAIHVKLSNEAVDFVMPEISRQNNLLKLVDILDDELYTCW